MKSVKEVIAEGANKWYHFNHIEVEGQPSVRKRRCLVTGIVQRLETKEVWVLSKE
jgi:hypothetical protein